MRIKISTLVLILATSVVAAAPAHAATRRHFTFYGAGWGHGVGLSQWGAYGLSRHGWTAGRILTHFYPGSTVVRTPWKPDKIRVGVAQGRQAVHLTAVGAPVGLRVGSPGGDRIGRIPAGQTWSVAVVAGRYRIHDGRGRLVGGRAWGGAGTDLFVRPGHGVVGIPEAGHWYRWGWVQLEIYGCSPCAMRLVVVVSPERYVRGISEVPSDWPMPALQAQAVAARTYAFDRVRRLGQHRPGCDCGLYASTADQVYAGWDKEGGSYGSRWRAAVVSTAGRVLTYGGGFVEAFYHSSSGGYTDSSANVWGTSIPYLRGVCDPGDYTPANSNRAWRRTLTGAALGDRISRATGRSIGSVVRFSGTSRDVSGRILGTTVVGSNGTVRVSGHTLESAVGLPSNRVWVNHNRLVVDPIRPRYDALECHPGLAMSPQVRVPGGLRQRFVHGALYRNGKRGRTFWVHASPYRRYRRMHESSGPLGMPRSDLVRLRAPAGCGKVRCLRVLFEHGAIYLKPGPGLHALHGEVFRAFFAHGGTSRLGFPTSEIRTGARGSRYATFERGVIRCRHGHCRVRRR